jgi:hypothetical protein
VTTWWLRAAGASAALVGALALGSCSLGFELDREQCEKTSDCAAFGAAECIGKVCVAIEADGGGGAGGSPPVDPNWDCLADFTPPDPGGETVIHSFKFVFAVDETMTPANLSIDVCSSTDLTCASPQQSGLEPDAQGRLAIELDVGQLNVYLKATSTETMPTTVFLQTPVKIPQSEKVIRMVDEALITVLAQQATEDDEWDPMKSSLVVTTSNCLDERASVVRVESMDGDANTVPFYFENGFPNPDATATDTQGAAGFLNMPVGPATVKIYRADTDEFIGSGTYIAQAGVLSYLPIGPTEN